MESFKSNLKTFLFPEQLIGGHVFLSVLPLHCLYSVESFKSNFTVYTLWCHSNLTSLSVCNGVVVVEGQDTGSGVRKNGDHSRRTAAIRFYLLSRRQFSAHTKSSRARIDKRTARAARNTHYRYNQNGPPDHKMADNCVSLARTNTVSSTITKPIKT